MDHDIQAAWATSELAQKLNSATKDILANFKASSFTAYASQESRREWPIADGLIAIEESGQSPYSIAVEFKRQNEGLHGVLTALGQAHSYLKKGYAGAAIVIPEKYDSHASPGEHLSSVLSFTSPDLPIGVFKYRDPDPGITSPFKDKITTVRHIDLSKPLSTVGSTVITSRTTTQWAHLREGSSDPDAFFKYLLTAKLYTGPKRMVIPKELTDAIKRVSPHSDPVKYLSNTSGNSPQDEIWRRFWFKYVLTKELLPPWRKESGDYFVNLTPSKIISSKKKSKFFFSSKSDSIKNKLVVKLNAKEISEDQACELYVKNIRDRAHSYREDVDSGLEHLGFLENDGRPSDLGYRFVDACERQGDANAGLPKSILGAAILKNGQLAALLHYIHRLSDELFSRDSLAFASYENNRLKFSQQEYLKWIEDELSNKLCVMRKVSLRGGKSRKPFQGEFAILRNLNYISGFRPGIGLVINWPTIQEVLELQI